MARPIPSVPPERPPQSTSTPQKVKSKEPLPEGPTFDCLVTLESTARMCAPRLFDQISRSAPKEIKNVYSAHYPSKEAKRVQIVVDQHRFPTHGK